MTLMARMPTGKSGPTRRVIHALMRCLSTPPKPAPRKTTKEAFMLAALPIPFARRAPVVGKDKRKLLPAPKRPGRSHQPHGGYRGTPSPSQLDQVCGGGGAAQGQRLCG